MQEISKNTFSVIIIKKRKQAESPRSTMSLDTLYLFVSVQNRITSSQYEPGNQVRQYLAREQAL